MDTPSAVVTFDASLFSEETIKKAAYTFAAAASVDIRRSGVEWVCAFRFLRPMKPEDIHETVESFRIEVLDQDLRERVAAETRETRNSILAVAFSRTGLQRSE